MAEITKVGKPTPSTPVPSPEHRIAGLLAGEALVAGDACRVNSDGKVYRSSGAAANANAKVHGYAAVDTPIGEAVSLLFGMNFVYGSGLTPGASLFLSGTVAGGLADAASTGGTAPIGFVVDPTRVHLRQSTY